MLHGLARRQAAADWRWAVPRLLGWVGAFVVLGVLLGTAWLALGPPATDVAALFGTSVTAVAAVAAGALLLRYADGRPVAALGLGVSRVTAPQSLAGIGIGALALAGAALAMLATGSLRYASEPGTTAAWLSIVAVQGAGFTIAAFAEEAVFRGYAFQVLVRWVGPVTATLATALLFAVAHAWNPEVGVFALVNIFLAGVMLAVAYLRTLSLWFATAVHVGWNWAMATLLDLPVSGIAGFDTPYYEPVIGGPDWWSGGAFGPEGGLVGTFGFGIALGALLLWKTLRPDPGSAGAGPLIVDGEGSRHDG